MYSTVVTGRLHHGPRWKKVLCSGNLILSKLAKCCDTSIFALVAKYHTEPQDVVYSSVEFTVH